MLKSKSKVDIINKRRPEIEENYYEMAGGKLKVLIKKHTNYIVKQGDEVGLISCSHCFPFGNEDYFYSVVTKKNEQLFMDKSQLDNPPEFITRVMFTPTKQPKFIEQKKFKLL